MGKQFILKVGEVRIDEADFDKGFTIMGSIIHISTVPFWFGVTGSFGIIVALSNAGDLLPNSGDFGYLDISDGIRKTGEDDSGNCLLKVGLVLEFFGGLESLG